MREQLEQNLLAAAAALMAHMGAATVSLPGHGFHVYVGRPQDVAEMARMDEEVGDGSG